MTTCFLAPDPVQGTFFIPGGNVPGNGVLVFFYVSGSSTKQTAYKDPAASVAWSNPIVLDSGGNLPLGGEVWFPAGLTFTVKWAPSNDTDPPASPYRTMDNLSGMNDTSSGLATSDWVSGPTPTFVSGTSFTLVGDQTLIFTNGRRIKTTNTGGTVYSTITSVSFAGVTTVRIVNDFGALDAGLSAVFYGLIDPSASSIDYYHISRLANTVTTQANGTTDLWGINGTFVHITGTNAIFSFSTAAYSGAERLVIADTAFPLNSSATLNLIGGNTTTTPGDRFRVVASTGVSVISSYQPSSIIPIIGLPTSNTIYAGPASGAAASPTFRTLVATEASMTLIDIKTAANTSVVNMTTGITSSFRNYIVIGNGIVPVVSNIGLDLNMSADGVNYDVSAGYRVASLVLLSTGASANNNGAATTIPLCGSTGINSTVSLGGMHFSLNLRNPGALNSDKQIDWSGGYAAQATKAIVTGAGFGTSAQTNASSVVAIQFSMLSGNISTGTFSLYGIRT